MSTIITIENLSKAYRIGLKEQMPDSLMSAATAWIKSPLKNFHRLQRLNTFSQNGEAEDIIWALNDISFEVKEGEVVGIIGRNGAGKSTLLKILSRITEPTHGRAIIRGRISSLLEVGTGFHPELTGRENIYLNGTVLGMTKKEINQKFDEIVDFSGVEKFLDTPIKRYSSGMQVRLAFSVAAHLEPEILIVDEVLAVGDSLFQKKCLGKMRDLAKEGARTVIFVSHNMPAVLSLCTRSFVISSGEISFEGTADSAVNHYLRSLRSITECPLNSRNDRTGNAALRFVKFLMTDKRGLPLDHVCSGQDVKLAFQYETGLGRKSRNVRIDISVHGKHEEYLFHLSTHTFGHNFEEVPHKGTIFCNIPHLPLQPGRYGFNLCCFVNGEIADYLRNAGWIEVEAGDFFGTGQLPSPKFGQNLVVHSWSI